MMLSETQSLVLSKASEHPMGFALAPKHIPAAAREAVYRSLVSKGLVTQHVAMQGEVDFAWQDDTCLRISDAGLRAIGVDPNEGDAVADTAPLVAPAAEPEPQDPPPAEAAQGAPLAEDVALLDQALAAPTTTTRANLREAAQRALDAWDDEANQRYDLAEAMEALRGILIKPARLPRETTPRQPREGTKMEKVLALLRRPEGASGPQMAEATGWNANTVRGFLAGLKKKGCTVEVLERVRQVGPNKVGAKGSYSVYRIAEAG